MPQPNTSIDLSQFLEEITLSVGEKIPGVYAYRMDGDKNMAKYADLGTPSCCDYLYFNNDTTATLFEDTCFGQTLKSKLREIELLNINNENKNFKEYFKKTLIEVLKKDICIKVYGSFIILCRLEKKHQNIAEQLADRGFSFWFIINDEEGDIPAIDHLGIDMLQTDLKETLEGTLTGAKLVKNIKVLFKRCFKKKLNHPM